MFPHSRPLYIRQGQTDGEVRMTRIVLLALKNAAAPSIAVIIRLQKSAPGYVDLCEIWRDASHMVTFKKSAQPRSMVTLPVHH